MDIRRDPLPPREGERWSEETVVDVRWWTSRLLSFRLTRPATFLFRPGHYARLGVEDGEGGEVLWRPYSMVSTALEETLEFVATVVPDGAFSRYLAELKPGRQLRLDRAAYGFLTLDQLAPGRDLWLLATGSGIGPFVSILRDAAVWQDFRHLVVVHSVRESAELAYRDELAALSARAGAAALPATLHYVPVVTREAGAALGARLPQLLDDGRLEAGVSLPLAVENARVMVCGNPGMAGEVRQRLAARGFTTGRRGIPGQMAFERYW